MSLRIQLTLWSVLVMTLIVGVVTAVDLLQEVRHQFDSTLDRANFYIDHAADLVQSKANRDRTVPVQVALRRDQDLSRELLNLMTASKSLYEIAVCDSQEVILSDSDPEQINKKCPSYPDFERLVKGGVIEKTSVWLKNLPQKYQLSKGLGVGNKPEIYVRVVVWPGLIQKDMIPTIWQHAELSAFLLAGAIVAAILFSAIAFRPIGKLGHMLDLLMSGEYENQQVLPPAKSRTDEFQIVASKVNLLGQQLRGAQYDFSDLRGNFERLLDDLEDAVLVFGRDRRLVVTAGAVEKFLGRERSELMGRPLVEVFPPSTSLGLLLQQAAQTGLSIRNRRVPMDASNNGGSAGVAVALLSVDVLEALHSNVVTGAGAGILVRLRDPEATRQIGRQLQIADRVSAISRITGGVAHEVKNPLNAILMHVELARMKIATGDSDLKPQMDIIASEIVRLDRVVKTFLDFTRPVELHPVDVPLESFVNDIAEFARPLAETAKIEVNVDQQTEGASISVDLDLLKQAMLNVVINAIDAMPDGGELLFQSSVDGHDAEIRISDTGCGIPPSARNKIFGLYFTTKEKGSGIGLAMTFRIVQLHDGTIDFTSEPGKGTTFIIRVPMAVSSD
jgi:signal transduction histidine kinase/HAMP domain-containing protein